MSFCPNCAHENHPQANYCTNCGFFLAGQCRHCGTANPKGAKFCMKCGESLEAGLQAENQEYKPLKGREAERRQLTVMFCDLVGSTPLSEKLDPEEFRQVILDYQQLAGEVIQKWGGHTAQYLGDGLLVYFGYPQGLENAPRAGIEAGLDILGAIRLANPRRVEAGKPAIAVRIGIHTGLVVVDERLALGRTTNVAARLQAMAPENSLVISPDTRQLVEGWFKVASLGEHTLKGIAEPMEVFEVLKAGRATSRFDIARKRGLSPLVGRRAELKTLEECWGKARNGRGQVVMIHGEAGIGKSRLGYHLKNEVHRTNEALILEMRCSEYHQNSPFYPVLELLEREILKIKREESGAARFEKLKAWLENEDEKDSIMLPLLASFLSLPVPPAAVAILEKAMLIPATKKKMLVEKLLRMIFQLARSRPVFLFIEDLHWSDTSTREWLDYLVKGLLTYPIFALCTTRPGFKPDWLNAPHATLLELSRLSGENVTIICRHQSFGKPFPGEVLEQIKTKTDGIPLFVEELSRMLVESGLLTEKADHFELTAPLPAHAIPSTLRDSLITRLDRLSAAAREILQIGAVLGREFSFEFLKAVAGKPSGNLREALAQLVASELLLPQETPSTTSYLFRHALIQDTAYATLLRRKRQNLHQQVVKVLEKEFPETAAKQPELIAYHLTEGGAFKEAIAKWEEAGLLAFSRSAHHDVVHHFHQGLRLLPYIEDTTTREDRELQMLLPYIAGLMASKGFSHPEVKKNGERIIELCSRSKDYPSILRGYHGLSAYYIARGNHELAIRLGKKGRSLAKQINNGPFEALFNAILATPYNATGQFRQALQSASTAARVYNEYPDPTIDHLGSGNISVYAGCELAWAQLLLGYPDQARQEMEKWKEKLPAVKNIISRSRIHLFHFLILAETGQWKEAGNILQSFLPEISESGEAFWLANTQLFLEITLARFGEERALQTARHISDQLAAGQILFFQAYTLYNISQVHFLRKEIALGMETLEEAFRMVQQTEEWHHLAMLNHQKGLFLLADNDKAAAEAAFLRAIDIARQQSARWFELIATTSLGRLWQTQGRKKEAHARLKAIYEWFTEGRETSPMQEAKELLELLT